MKLVAPLVFSDDSLLTPNMFYYFSSLELTKISMDLHDFKTKVLSLDTSEIFILGIMSNECNEDAFLRFLKIVIDQSNRTNEWTSTTV